MSKFSVDLTTLGELSEAPESRLSVSAGATAGCRAVDTFNDSVNLLRILSLEPVSVVLNRISVFLVISILYLHVGYDSLHDISD